MIQLICPLTSVSYLEDQFSNDAERVLFVSMKRGFSCIGLHQPKDTNNIGSVLRACGCFSVDLLAVAGKRYHHAPTDTQKSWRHLPFLEVEDLKSIVPKGCSIIAVDLVEGAESLITFQHPERAFYIFGGEDRTLGDDILPWCDSRVSIPTSHCLNLAATVNVVLYDRMAKQATPTP